MSETEVQDGRAEALIARLDRRCIVLVGLMGAGKTAIGKKLSARLGLPFVDSDHEIETVSRQTVPELFERYGEPEFRALEARVIDRLVRDGPQVLATGGGAFLNPQTRVLVAEHAITVWLKAELDVLMDRVMKKHNRPLLKTGDPRATMARLIDERHPVYALADVTVLSRDEKREVITDEVLTAVMAYLEGSETAKETS